MALLQDYSVDGFLKQAITDGTRHDFIVSLSYDGKEFYTSAPSLDRSLALRYAVSDVIPVQNRFWDIRITPTKQFVQEQLSSFPMSILIAGILIAILLSLTVRYVLIARIRSDYLRKANSLNDAVLASATYMIVATDTNGNVIIFNRAAEKALGYTAQEIIRKQTPALWHDLNEIKERSKELSRELGYRVPANFQTFIVKARHQGTHASEWTLIRKDGTRFPANVTVTTLKSGDRLTGYLGIIEDISERKAQQTALEHSESMFRTSMESASIGMALVGLDGKWLRVNSALCNILGYSAKELLDIDFQTITHPDDLDSDLTQVQRVLNGEIQSYQMEKRYIHKNGHTLWANLSVSLARDSKGNPEHFISQVMDVTEQHEAERMKADFISMVSHELRTPLTSIRGSLGLIAGTWANDLPEKVTRLIQIAHENSERLIILINDILDIDKITSVHMRFDMEDENLETLLHKAIDANQAYADRFKVDLKLKHPVDPVTVHVDANRFLQVITNLASNAIKFSPEQETVAIYTTVLRKRVRIHVQDNGPGISEEFKTRIFRKFSQADSSITRTKGGTGLGLNISKEIVEHMNGTIGFNSTVGKGSTFWVEFPIHTSEASSKTVAPHTHVRKKAKPENHLPKVLHVEDDTSLTNFFKNALTDRVDITSATSIKVALQKIKKNLYDLIILDIGLPDGSGIDFFNFLQDTEAYKNIPVIILSAHDTPEDIKEKVADYLVKSRDSESEIIASIIKALT